MTMESEDKINISTLQKKKNNMRQNNPTEHFMARCPTGHPANVRGHRGRLDSIDNRWCDERV